MLFKSLINLIWTYIPNESIVIHWDIDNPILWWIPELKHIVGIRGIDWYDHMIDFETVEIKFRKGKTQYASYFLIKWHQYD